jgi:polar amino acid transport system substrate-binding protein
MKKQATTLRTTRNAKILGALSLGVSALLSLSACAPASSSVDANCTPEDKFSTITPGSLTVSTYEFAPHMKLAGDGLSGVEGELLTEFAKRECLTIKVESAGGASSAVPAVQAGRADLAAGDWYRTKARSELVTLSDPLYLDQGALVSKSGLKTIAELEGKKIASVVGNLWNDDFKKTFGDDFAVYQDPEAVFQDLASGRIDAVIDSVAATSERFKSAPVDGAEIVPLEADPRIAATARPGQLNWPTNKSNPELTGAINNQIKKFRDSGLITDVLKKYGVDPSVAETGAPDLL